MYVHDTEPATSATRPTPARARSGSSFSGHPDRAGLENRRRWGVGALLGLVALLAVVTTACAGTGGATPATPTTASAVAETGAGAGSSVGSAVGTVDATLERPAGLSRADDFSYTSMARGLKQAADKVARGSDPTFDCVSVLVHAEGPSADAMAGAAKKATEQCGREIPLVWAARQLDVAESNGSLAKSIGECASAKVALDGVSKRFTDPRVDLQRARVADVCS